MIDFKDEEKLAAFDSISRMYFEKNFGVESKSNIELIMFDIYLKHKKMNNENDDDYTVSKELGITQTRVRSLKERRQLVYPDEKFDWKSEFVEHVQYAKCDLDYHRIKMTLPDVNVLREFQYFVEYNGWNFETQLNSKFVQLPFDCFVDICLKIEESGDIFDNETKHKISKLQYEAGVGNFLNDFTKEGLKDFLKAASVDVMDEVFKCIPFGNMAKTAFLGLIKAIRRTA